VSAIPKEFSDLAPVYLKADRHKIQVFLYKVYEDSVFLEIRQQPLRGVDLVYLDHSDWKIESLWRKIPNQQPLPTPASDTPAAGAPVAPPSRAAGL
jgi:hypothetical protein